MQDNASPEERLLRLIRRGPQKKTAQTDKDKDRPKDSSPLQQNRPRPKTPVLKSGQEIWSGLASLNLLRRILQVLILVFLIYLFNDLLINTPDRIEEEVLLLNQAEKPIAGLPAKTHPAPALPVAYYQAPVEAKNIFTAQEQDEKKAPSLTFREMVAKLRLQGIISGANPQAIIEDTKSKQVHFLSPGEYIGELKVKEIFSGKVTLEFYGQEADLKL